MDTYNFPSVYNDEFDSKSKKLLSFLSSNSRTKQTDLAKDLEYSRPTIIKKIHELEKQLQIQYTIEFNEETIGLSQPHIIFIKFEKKPDYQKILSLFENHKLSYIPQIIVSLKDDKKYDLLIYANSPHLSSYVAWKYNIQLKLAESNQKVELWNESNIYHIQRGFFPLRNALLDKLNLKNSIIGILKELNKNATSSFHEISKKISKNFDELRYDFERIQNDKYVKKFTLVANPPKNTELMYIVAKYRFAVSPNEFENDAKKARQILTTDDSDTIVSRYLFVCNMGDRHHYFLLACVDNKARATQIFESYKKSMKNHLIESNMGFIDQTLLGKLPIRSMSHDEFNPLYWNLK